MERERTLGRRTGNTVNDKRFEFLHKAGISAKTINKHTELWNESILKGVLMKPFLDLTKENLRYILEKTRNEDFVLYLFFLYNDAFLFERNTFICSIATNLEKTFDRIFSFDTDGIVALYGKGKKIILKKIEAEN